MFCSWEATYIIVIICVEFQSESREPSMSFEFVSPPNLTASEVHQVCSESACRTDLDLKVTTRKYSRMRFIKKLIIPLLACWQEPLCLLQSHTGISAAEIEEQVRSVASISDEASGNSYTFSRLRKAYFDVVARYRGYDPAKLVQERERTMQLLEERASEPETIKRDKEIKKLMTESTMRIVGRLNLGWLERTLEDLGYADVEIVRDVARGFDPTAEIVRCGIFDEALQEEECELQQSGKNARKRKMRKKDLTAVRECKPNFSDELLERVAESIVEESKNGICSTPETIEQLRERFKSENREVKAISYAFPVLQKGKVRVCVDDRWKNELVKVAEKVYLEDLRAYVEILALLNAPEEFLTRENWIGICQDKKKTARRNSEYLAAVRRGEAETSRRPLAGFDISAQAGQQEHTTIAQLGMACVDLVAAYKQLAVADASKNIVGFWSGSRYLYVEYYCLTFGSRASVYGFLRFSYALVFIMREALNVVVSAYVDDFNAFERLPTIGSAMTAIQKVLNLAGVRFHGEDEPKKTFVGRSGKVLGAEIDLNGPEPVIDVSFEGRLEMAKLAGEIHDRIDEELDDSLQKLVSRLVGKLVFLLSVTVFRGGYHFMRALFTLLGRFRQSLWSQKELMKGFFKDLKTQIFRFPAFVLSLAGFFKDAIEVYTDAAWTDENGKATARIGGVLYVQGMPMYAFSVSVDGAVVREKCKGTSPIMVLEVLAARYAIRLWSAILRGRRVRAGIDNTSGEFAIIGGKSKSRQASRIVMDIHQCVMAESISIWWEYVNTSNNPADKFTRLSMAELREFCAREGTELLVNVPEAEDMIPS